MRSAFLKNQKFFGVPAIELRAYYNKEKKLEQVDLVYVGKELSGFTSQSMKYPVSQSARALFSALTARWGKPSSKKYGVEGRTFNVPAWQIRISEIFLEDIDSKFLILHILIGDGRNPASIGEIEKLNLRGKNFSVNVKRNDFGDVSIENIPMVIQSSKGFCAPATVERVLRYYGVSWLTMYSLADKAAVKRDKSTSFKSVTDATDLACRAVKLYRIHCGKIRMATIKRNVDMGIPVFCFMKVNSHYEQLCKESRAKRAQAKSPKEWKKYFKVLKLPESGTDTLCLITGYNDETDEVAVSNSVGGSEIEPVWVPFKAVRKLASMSSFILLSPTGDININDERRRYNNRSRGQKQNNKK